MNIEEHRQPWESDEHWVFRKEFLIAHQGKFTEDRLLCLAQVFANVELLGCRYPAPVMRQVNELAKEISCLESIRKKRIDKATVKFVKASDDPPRNTTGNKRLGDTDPYKGQVKFLRSESQANIPGKDDSKCNRTSAASYFTDSEDRASGFPRKSNAGESLSPQLRSISISPKDQNDSDVRPSFDLNRGGERGHTVYNSKNAVIVDCDPKLQTSMSFRNLNEKANLPPGSFVSSHDGHIRDMPIQSGSKPNVKKNKYGLNEAIVKSMSVSNKFQKLIEVMRDNQPKNNHNPVGLLDTCTRFCFMKLFWKTDPTPVTDGISANLTIDNINVGSGKAPSLKKVKSFIYQSAIDVLFNPNFHLVKDNKGNFVVSTECVNQLPAQHAQQSVRAQKNASSIEKRFYNLAEIIKAEKQRQPNALQIIQVSAQKASLKVFFSIDELPPEKTNGPKVNPTFICKLFLEGILASQCKGLSKKDARVNAYAAAVSKMQEPFLKVVDRGGDLELVTSRTPLNMPSAPVKNVTPAPVGKVDIALQRQNKNIMVNSEQAMEELLLISDLGVRESANHISAVQQSADFNRVPCLYKETFVKEGNRTIIRYQVFIGGQNFGEGFSENLRVAKLEAAKDAWNNLQKRFYTVQIKELICEEQEKVSKSNLSMGGRSNEGEAPQSDPGPEGKSLSQDNIGFKMLQMMGWGGGGVGKKGNEGIVQPVSLKDVYKREGLGFNRDGRQGNFRKGINEVIKNFVESGTCSDLAFSPEFSKEERVYIHRIAEKYNLRNTSHGGKGANRHVVLSRRFRPQQLLEHLLSSGGSTKKYELIPPTDYSDY